MAEIVEQLQEREAAQVRAQFAAQLSYKSKPVCTFCMIVTTANDRRPAFTHSSGQNISTNSLLRFLDDIFDFFYIKSNINNACYTIWINSHRLT